MRFRERRLRFENLEQRKVFAADVVSELPGQSISHDSSTFDAVEVSEPVEGDGVRAAEVRIQFDPLSVQPDLASIKAGDAWNGKASVVANVDEVAGTLVAFVFTTRPITAQGNLLELEFKSAGSDATNASPSSIGIEQVRLNEGQFEVTSELTVLAAPPRALDPATELVDSEDVVDAIPEHGDAANHDHLFADGLASEQDLAAEHGLTDSQSWLHEIVEGNQAAVPCKDDDAVASAARQDALSRLQDLQVTSVFIGPVRPDFLPE